MRRREVQEEEAGAQDERPTTNDTGISKKAMSIMHCMCVDMFKRIAAEVRGHV